MRQPNGSAVLGAGQKGVNKRVSSVALPWNIQKCRWVVTTQYPKSYNRKEGMKNRLEP